MKKQHQHGRTYKKNEEQDERVSENENENATVMSEITKANQKEKGQKKR